MAKKKTPQDKKLDISSFFKDLDASSESSESFVLDVLEELANTSKTNEKISILEKYRESKELQHFFSASLDKFKNYYIKEATFPGVKSDFKLTKSKKTIIDFCTEFLPIIYKRELTGHAAINALSDELSNYSVRDVEVIKRIMFNDPKCGVSGKIVNKIWSGIIKEIPYMRCSGSDKLKNLSYPAIVQRKSDGTFCNIIIKDSKINFMTRNGSEFYLDTLGSELSDIVSRYPELDNTVLIGELTCVVNGVVENRQTGNGNISKLIKRESTIATAKGDKKHELLAEHLTIDRTVVIDLWDFVPLNEWSEGLYNVQYNERFSSLSSIIKKIKSEKIRLIDSKVVYSEKELMSFNKMMMDAGEEGSVAKNMKAIFKHGTSTDQMKIKAVLDADLLCTGWYHGNAGTEFEDGLGGLTLESADGSLKVSVGSGFSRLQRGLEPVDNKDITKGLKRTDMNFDDEYIGKIVTIEYNGILESKNKPGEYSCFLPVFVEVRSDKSEADSVEKLLTQGVE